MPTSYYRFTLTKFTTEDEWADDRDQLEAAFKDLGKHYCFQLEKAPSTGRLHFQCRVSLKQKKTEIQVRKIFGGAHVETEHDWQQSTMYTMKEDTRIQGPWMDRKTQVSTYVYTGEDLQYPLLPWQQKLHDYLKKKPNRREIIWYYDPEGCSGKSYLVKYLQYHLKARSFGWSDTKHTLHAVASATPASIYLFDLTRTKPKEFSAADLYASMESIKNGNVSSSMYDSPTLLFPPPHVVIFANTPPDSSKISKDRWNIQKVPRQVPQVQEEPRFDPDGLQEEVQVQVSEFRSSSPVSSQVRHPSSPSCSQQSRGEEEESCLSD